MTASTLANRAKRVSSLSEFKLILGDYAPIDTAYGRRVVPVRDWSSVHQHRQGSFSDRGHRVDQEAAAIGGDDILEQYDTRCDDSRLEEDVGHACHRLVMRLTGSIRNKY
jgi:hypothetical protein